MPLVKHVISNTHEEMWIVIFKKFKIEALNRVDDDDSYEYLQEMNFVPYETLLHNNMNTSGFVVPFVMQQVRDTWSFFHFLSISFILERFLW